MISKLTAQLKNIFTGMKLHSKLMLSYFLACTIPLLIVEAIYFSASAGSLEDASKEFTEMYTSQLTSSIDNYIQNYDRIFMSMFVESNVLQQLNKDTSSMIEQIGFSAVMDTLLLRLRTLNPDAKRIIIISANNKVYQSTGSGAFIDPEILKNQAWFQEIIKSGENLVITSTHDQAYNGSNNTDNVFTISRIIYNTSGVYSGVLMFEIDPAQMLKLDNANSLLRNKYGIKLILTALSGGLVYHSDIMNGTATWENIQRQFDLTRKKGPAEDVTVITQTSNLGKLTITAEIPQKKLLSRISRIKNTTYILTVVSLLFIILVSFLFSQYITRPIKALRKNMKLVEAGQYTPILFPESNDELGVLVKSYNKMISKIDTLIDEVYVSEIKQKQAKILALKTQINPHMLYNTLESIRMKAHLKEDEEVADMINLLAHMFRISLSSDDNLNLIRHEVEYARNYLELQNIRYDNLFSLEVNLDDKILEHPIIGMVFQPIIENAITHGFMGYDHPVKITIEGVITIDNNILITFRDNGIGISSEKSEDMNRYLESTAKAHSEQVSSGKSGSSIGLKNINERIKLHYGNEYFICIQPGTNGGTTIKLLIPKK